MNLKNKSDKRNYIIIALCLILVVMGVGYAAFSSLLTINGTASISNSWCVGFDSTLTSSYTTKTGITGGTAPTGSISFSGSTCETKYQPNASLTANFKQPGDQVEYTLTIKNKSTLPVAIKSILVENNSVTTDTTIKKGNIEFIVHMPESTNLAVDGETTMKVVARFQNTTDVTGVYNGEQQSINVKINAEQGTGTDGMETTYTGTVYRHNTNRVHNGDNINNTGTVWVIANSTGGEYSDEYNTETECQTGYEEKNSPSGFSCQIREKGVGSFVEEASMLNKTYYLRHDIAEDVITNSYTCFVYNNSEHCMKGADGGASFTQNTQIIKDFQTFNNLGAFNYNGGNPIGCAFDEAGNSHCYGGGLFHVYATYTGLVYASGSSGSYCVVSHAGYSYCAI